MARSGHGTPFGTVNVLIELIRLETFGDHAEILTDGTVVNDPLWLAESQEVSPSVPPEPDQDAYDEPAYKTLEKAYLDSQLLEREIEQEALASQVFLNESDSSDTVKTADKTDSTGCQQFVSPQVQLKGFEQTHLGSRTPVDDLWLVFTGQKALSLSPSCRVNKRQFLFGRQLGLRVRRLRREISSIWEPIYGGRRSGSYRAGYQVDPDDQGPAS
ncbi:MAG: hypothetical protein M1823_000329 [Watsoniomyces obsoletus]|nr:MAG: hypothetical protein M1823_000329 [Watsoniomyces obsoletus]